MPPGEASLRVLAFGSRHLGAQHLPAMVAALRRVAGTCGPEVRLVLVHGDGPPGASTPGAVGADKLAEVAAHLAWAGRLRGLKRHPARWLEEGKAAGPRRNRRMAESTRRPFRVLCFHTSSDFEGQPGSGSASMAAELRRLGVGYTLVLLGRDGALVREEERR